MATGGGTEGMAHHDTPPTPLKHLVKVMSFAAGFCIRGMAVDSVRDRVVERRKDTRAPITVYDFHGQQLQVLGKDLAGAAGTGQRIAIDTKRITYA